MALINYTRIARDLVYDTLLYYLMQEIGLPSGSILFDSPPPIYVNTRTSTSGSLEEGRYPIISINPIKSTPSYNPSTRDVQQASYSATGLVQNYTSIGIMENIMEFCLHTATKRDYEVYKNALDNFFGLYKGFTILNDPLPERADSFNLLLMDSSEDLLETPYECVYTVKLIYRSYQEKLSYLLFNYVLSGNIQIRNTNTDITSGIVNDLQTWLNFSS